MDHEITLAPHSFLSTSLNPPQLLLFEELVAIFLKNKDLKATSEQAYKASFYQFSQYVQVHTISVVTEQHIKEFKQYLLEKKLSIFTVIAHIGALKSLFSFLATRSLYPNVARDIKSPKKPREFMRNALTKEQAGRLLEACKGDSVLAQRNYAILSTLLRCGLRSIEIIRADIVDVRTCNGTPVLWVHGKGRDSKDEFVVLTHAALKAIKSYLALRVNIQESEPLFVSHGPRNGNGRLTTKSIRRMVKECLRGIGLDEKELTCHSLRHTFATLALANNAPLLAVQRAMRHANINTTTIYTHMADRLTHGAETFIDI